MVFLDMLSFSCHCTFIARNINTFKEETVSRYFHSLLNPYNVTDNKFRDIDCLSKAFTSSKNRNFFDTSRTNKFLKLFFFGPVVLGLDSDNQGDSTINTDTINPSNRRL
jgi:hypothetical protein